MSSLTLEVGAEVTIDYPSEVIPSVDDPHAHWIVAEIDIAIGMFRQTHPGSFGEMVSELRAEVGRLKEAAAQHASDELTHMDQAMEVEAALRAEVGRLTAELAEAQAAAFPPNEDGQRFEPGNRYITDNECFVFHCERVVAGIALGIEVRTDGRPGFTSQRVYHSVMPEGCWRELDAVEPSAEESGRIIELERQLDEANRRWFGELAQQAAREDPAHYGRLAAAGRNNPTAEGDPA